MNKFLKIKIEKVIKTIFLFTTISSLFSCVAIHNLQKKETSNLISSSISRNSSDKDELTSIVQCKPQAFIQTEIESETNRILDSLQSNSSVINNLMQTESIGEFKIDDSAKQILEHLGNPETKSENVMWGSDGLYHQTWNYPKQGISLGMVSETAKDEQKVSSITLTEPSQLKTQREIGIGDYYEKVEEAYEKEKDVDNSITCESFVAGSIYGGIVFSFREGRVSRIFLGSVAE